MHRRRQRRSDVDFADVWTPQRDRAQARELQGIRGWLLVFALLVVLGVLLDAYGLYVVRQGIWRELANRNSAAVVATSTLVARSDRSATCPSSPIFYPVHASSNRDFIASPRGRVRQ